MKTAIVLTTSVLFLPLLLADFSTQDSSCRVIWLLNVPCVVPHRALVQQVVAWSSSECVDEQQKCKYELIQSTPSFLEVIHTSPDLKTATVMYFDFYPPENPQFCKIGAYSVTSPSNATNTNEFCLFHNLFQASGLTNAPGYREITNDGMCPSMASATCYQGDKQL